MVNPDNIVKVVAVALILAHIVVAVWLRRRIGWVIALDLIMSAGVVAYWLPDISELPGYIPMVWIFVGFEAIAFVASVAALFVRVPRAVLWVIFAVHALLAAGAAVFMFTFQLTRLI